MYNFIFSHKYDKQFVKLDKNIQLILTKTLERIKFRPLNFVKKLAGIPLYSFRVRNYRIILDIKERELIILILEMGHRRNIYKDIIK
jgi:mRNA interferase RelE/StbE